MVPKAAISSTVLDANKIDALYVSFAYVIHTQHTHSIFNSIFSHKTGLVG